MSQMIKVSAVVLSLADGRRLELSASDARALHAQLAELFGCTTVQVRPPVIVGPADLPIASRSRWPRVVEKEFEPVWYSDPSSPQPEVWLRGEPATRLPAKN